MKTSQIVLIAVIFIVTSIPVTPAAEISSQDSLGASPELQVDDSRQPSLVERESRSMMRELNNELWLTQDFLRQSVSRAQRLALDEGHYAMFARLGAPLRRLNRLEPRIRSLRLSLDLAAERNRSEKNLFEELSLLRSELEELRATTQETLESPRSGRTSNTAQLASGAISGTITDSATAMPIVSAFVWIYDASGFYVTYGYTNASGNYTTSASLATGTYYAITYNWNGYIDELYDNNLCLGGGLCDPTMGSPISVTDGSTTTGIDFALDPGGRISGTITDSATTTGIIDVEVDIYDSTGNYITYGYSDASGVYITNSGLTTGTYYAITYNWDSYFNELYDNIPCISYCTPTSGTAISVTVEATTSSIDFALEKGGAISGTITDSATAAGIDNSRAAIYDSTGNYITSGYADASGYYSTSGGLPDGTYYVRTYNWDNYVDELYDNLPCVGFCSVTGGTPISVTAAAVRASGVNFALEKGGIISGTITDSATAAGIGNSRAAIYNSAGSYLLSGYADTSGFYMSGSGLPAGTYYVRTYNSESYLEELYDNLPCVNCIVTGGTPVTVTAAATTSGIDFALEKGGAISGTITDSATAATIMNANVNIYNSTGSYVTYGYADASGSYTSNSGLPAGTYYARTYNSAGYVNELYDNLPCIGYCSPTSGTPITVTAKATTSNVDFALEKGGAISGTITDSATAAAIMNVEVDIYNSTGSYVTYGFTNASGFYTSYDGLPAGTYYARTYDSAGYVNELYDNFSCVGYCSVTSGTPITVTTGATTPGINFALDEGGVISGTITDNATAAGIDNSGVDVYDSAGNYAGSGYAVASGSYSTSGLPAGTYYVRTYNWAGYVDELYDNLLCFGGCTPTTGTPITVTVGTTTRDVDFGLDKGGMISGTVTETSTGDPLAGIDLDVFDDQGSFLSVFPNPYTDINGNYTIEGLPTGTYFVLADPDSSLGYIEELYDGFRCPPCDPTKSTPISVVAPNVTPGIDFSLEKSVKAAAAYIRGASQPWGQETNETAMREVFGQVGTGWNDLRMSSGNAPFLPGLQYRFIFLEGSQFTAYELSAYLSAYRSEIEAYVEGGGCLLLNSAPSQGGNMTWIFGATLIYPFIVSDVVAADPAHAVFSGPAIPVGTSYSGTDFAYAVVLDAGLTPILVGAPGDAGEGLTVLGEKQVGDGLVVMGAMTTDNFHSPQPDAANLRANIISYVSSCFKEIFADGFESGNTAAWSKTFP